jgi:hypothetical protein
MRKLKINLQGSHGKQMENSKFEYKPVWPHFLRVSAVAVFGH